MQIRRALESKDLKNWLKATIVQPPLPLLQISGLGPGTELLCALYELGKTMRAIQLCALYSKEADKQEVIWTTNSQKQNCSGLDGLYRSCPNTAEL